MNILVAPNAFKNSLDATSAAEAIAEGIIRRQEGHKAILFPVADGGDGTGELLINKLNATRISITVPDPLGRKIDAEYGILEEKNTAIIELANASGLRLLKPDEYNPYLAHTEGTGDMIRDAIARGCQEILLCIGGSATIDGGTGILRALGFRFLNHHGQEIKQPVDLVHLKNIESPVSNNTSITILCDVQNHLLGHDGAARVFGQQKGADLVMIPKLDEGLSKLREVIFEKTGRDINAVVHGGASGGVAAGLYGLLHARLVSGIDHFLYLTRFEEALKDAALVITGEGSIDHQTLQGKAPFGVAKMAKEKGIPVIGMAGNIPAGKDEALEAFFDQLICINTPGTPLMEALQKTGLRLMETAMKMTLPGQQ